MLSTNQERAQSIIVFGPGAACLFPDVNLMLYADMPRWEIQQRQRGHKIGGLGVNNAYELPSKQYKRGYFVDWDICDSLKKELLPIADYWIDSTVRELPKMIQGDTLRDGLKKAVRRPFRVVPFFDPAPCHAKLLVRYIKPTFERYPIAVSSVYLVFFQFQNSPRYVSSNRGIGHAEGEAKMNAFFLFNGYFVDYVYNIDLRRAIGQCNLSG